MAKPLTLSTAGSSPCPNERARPKGFIGLTAALRLAVPLSCAVAMGCDSATDKRVNADSGRRPQTSVVSPKPEASVVPQVTFEMEADRHYDRYSGPIGEYRIRVTIRNKGSSALRWDNARGEFFFIGATRTLNLPTHPASSGIAQIAAGDSDVFEYVTSSYTRELLDDARRSGKPLLFAMALRLGGSEVAGPYYVVLPPLESLPDAPPDGDALAGAAHPRLRLQASPMIRK